MMSNTEQIKDKIDIVDFISSYIKLEKSGINYKARCPFHNEKTPSFFVSKERQNFYCFGCGEKGDIFSFVEKFEGLDFQESLKLLANKAGIELKKIDAKQRSNQDGLNKLLDIMETSTEFFQKTLTNAPAVGEYLKKRGLTIESILNWRIGYSKDAWRDALEHLVNKGFTKIDLERTGMIKQSEEKYYDTFRDRIMFPMFDTNGKVIAFSGRIFKETKDSPKYLNSKETELFKKSDVLYGWNFAKDAIRKLDYVVLVEGQFDLVLSHQASVQNTVASSGTALTSSHLKKIKRFTNRIIFAYDSDSAGEKAVIRGAEIALTLGMEVKVVDLPKGEDPASIIQSSQEQWKNILRESKHIIDYLLFKLGKTHTGSKLIKEVEKNILPLVKRIASDIEKSHFIKKIANKINVDEEAIAKDLSKIKIDEIMEVKSSKNTKMSLERMLASIILSNKNIDIQTKWENIIGVEKVKEIILNYEEEKEALIFETEEYIKTGSMLEVAQELLNKVEIRELKIKLGSITKELDNTETNDRKEDIKKEIDKISKRLDVLFKNNIK